MIKYDCDSEYFKEINTEEQAYWLGFIFAEGWLSNEKSGDKRRLRFGIELSSNDE